MRAAKFGVTLPQIKRSWNEARDAALEFDGLGYDHVWVCDHVYGVPIPQLPIFEAWSELAAVAAITEHVELGTLVTPPFFRNPAILAKQVATIDHISNGRTIVGLGAGCTNAFPPGRGTRACMMNTESRNCWNDVRVMASVRSCGGSRFAARSPIQAR